jgi:uncharacterized membrane protein
MWINHNVRLFFDCDTRADRSLGTLLTLLIIIIPLLLVVAHSLYHILRTKPRRIWLFPVSLIVLPFLALLLPDLIWGGLRSTIRRYATPYLVGIQLMMAHLFAARVTAGDTERGAVRKAFWPALFAVVIGLGVISCAVSSRAATWWNKGPSQQNPRIARLINGVRHPLVVVERVALNPREILSMSHLLDPRVRVLPIPQGNTPEIPKGFRRVFLFRPSGPLRDRLAEEGRWQAVPVVAGDYGPILWELEDRRPERP